ncbi:pentapeptide repeat-containing protein [Achromobacter sp. ES-001]|uniref:pentapeptide repeat-containing protein n=1 Tax=Achromobacter sp. ES-001 TaxID=2860286 RepID=UPI00351CC4C0
MVSAGSGSGRRSARQTAQSARCYGISWHYLLGGVGGARLRGARLRGARLRGARLRGARLRGARLRGCARR